MVLLWRVRYRWLAVVVVGGGARGASPLGVLLVGIAFCHVPSVGDEDKRRVSVGGGIVSARAVLLGVPGLSSSVVLHLWAPCSSVLLLHYQFVVRGDERRVNIGGGFLVVRALWLGFLASRHWG